MKDIELKADMASTTVDRIASHHFTSDYSYALPSNFLINRTYPDSTDWSSNRPNPDELAAAIAIAQLSRTKHLAQLSCGKANREEPEQNMRWRGDESGNDIVIKCEPAEEEMICEEQVNDEYDQYDNYLDVNSNKYTSNHSSPTTLSPRIVLTTASSEVAPQRLHDTSLLRKSFDSSTNEMKWMLTGSHHNLSTEKPRVMVSPNSHLSLLRVSPDSRCASSSSINLPPTRMERLSPEPSMGYRYQLHAESQPTLNTYESYSQDKYEPKKRFETPTSFLKRKAQYHIDQMRRRCNSDDGGAVRKRILEGKFGSLSTIESYYRNLDQVSDTRSTLSDTAMDLSMDRAANNARFATETLKADTRPILNLAGRSTTELAMAFKLFQLNCAKQTNRVDEYSAPSTVNVLNNDNLERPTITTHKHVEPLENCTDLNERNKSVNEENTRLKAADSPSRKTRSPTFQLPDNHLPPKKRRIYDENRDSDEETKYGSRGSSHPSSPELAPSNEAEARVPVISPADSTRDTVLSAIRPDNQGDLPLHIAVVRGMTSVVERLVSLMLRLNKPLDTPNNQKQTALHLSFITGEVGAAGILLDAGASPHLTDGKGELVTHLAVRHGNLACLEALLQHSASADLDLNAKNHEGMTALHMAVHLDQYEAVKLLLSAGAQVDLRDQEMGRTALCLALEVEDLRMARLLLDCGADPTIASHSGVTPALLAAQRYRIDLIKLVRRSQAAER